MTQLPEVRVVTEDRVSALVNEVSLDDAETLYDDISDRVIEIGDLRYRSVGESWSLVKPSTTTRNNTITETDDPDLTTTLYAGNVYSFKAFLIYNATTVADVDIGFTIPSGSSILWVPNCPPGGASGSVSTQVNRTAKSNGNSAVNGGVGSDLVSLPEGIITMGGSDGTFAVKWAQSNIEATDATLGAGSRLFIERIG